MSRPPSIANTSSAAHACTGGLTSSNDHSYAASAPFGCWNHSRQSRISWYLANAGSTCASATQWKARSHAANHGYSHLSGIDMMSKASNVRQRALRPSSRDAGRRRLRRVAVEPARDVVVVELLAPEHPGERLAQDERLVLRRGGRRQLGVELVGLARRRSPRPRRSPAERVAAAMPRAGAGARAARPSRPARRRAGTRTRPSCPRVGVDGLGARDDVVVDAVLRVRRRRRRRRTAAACSSRSRRTARRGAPSARRELERRRGTGARSTTRSAPAPRGAAGFAASASQAHVFRNHAVGSTCSVAASGPAFVTRTVISRSCGSRLRVVDLDDPVAVLVERAGVEQLVLGIELAAPAVLGDQVARRGTRAAGSGSASGSTRGSAARRGTTSTPWRPRRGCPRCPVARRCAP